MQLTMMILVLYLNGSVIEFMGHHETSVGWERMGMSGCLQMKRTLKRNGWKDIVLEQLAMPVKNVQWS